VIYCSTETDPTVNLALEEWLLRTRSGADLALLLYRNDPVVVIGRNQNPWLECDAAELVRSETRLARRVSGGGAVYHDPGNLNVSFAAPRSLYEPERFMGLVVDALGNAGVDARLGGRHAIWVGDRKVAGSAFLLTGKSALLHACILVDADLARLSRCLNAPQKRIEAKAVRSEPAAVANLSEFRPGLAVDALAAEVSAAAREGLGLSGRTELTAEGASGDARFRGCLEKQRSWEWRLGRTPEFVHELRTEFAWGVVEVRFVVKDGVIVSVRSTSSGPTGQPILRLLSEGLCGVRYDGRSVVTKISALSATVPWSGPYLGSVGVWLKREIGPCAAVRV